jgi:hypothetical protein
LLYRIVVLLRTAKGLPLLSRFSRQWLLYRENNVDRLPVTKLVGSLEMQYIGLNQFLVLQNHSVIIIIHIQNHSQVISLS